MYITCLNFSYKTLCIHRSIIPAICVCVSVCVSVCLRLLFLDNHWSDLIETYHVYCWGPEYVHFQGLILIGQVVPKLWPFIDQTNDRTRCYDITLDVTIFFLHVRARTYGHVLLIINSDRRRHTYGQNLVSIGPTNSR